MTTIVLRMSMNTPNIRWPGELFTKALLDKRDGEKEIKNVEDNVLLNT